MRKIFAAQIMILFCLICISPSPAPAFTEQEAEHQPIPAEVIDKAFVRETHDNKAKRIATLEEGDGLDLLEEWTGGDAYPWYRVETENGEGWIYGQVVRRLDGGTVQTASAPAGKKTPPLEAGILSDAGDFVTVTARGQGTDRQKALEAAWIDAVRLAVGTIISSRSELNNDEFAENTIAHSRGVIESFDVVDEQSDGKRTTVTIQAKVQKEILRDATKIYGETQTVKADTGEAVKGQMDVQARDATAEEKQKSGAELLKEVLESYTPAMFYSAAIDPKIYFDKGTQKPYLKISEKFDEDLFWKDMLPKLRKALDGIAVKKEKKFYSNAAKDANQKLKKNGRFENQGISNEVHADWLYTWTDAYRVASWAAIFENPEQKIRIVLPDNESSYTVYYLPCTYDTYLLKYDFNNQYPVLLLKEERWEEHISDKELYSTFLNYIRKMASSVVFSILFLDENGNEIASQALQGIFPFPTVYRSFYDEGRGFAAFLGGVVAFAPGFIRYAINDRSDYVFLSTNGFEISVPLELDADELQRLDSMKLEIVFENR